jgi:hypothetical protein
MADMKGEVDASIYIDGAVVYAAVQNTAKKVMDMCVLKEEGVTNGRD